MNGLEIAVIAILGLSAYAGYKKGFLRVIYSILSWVIVLAFVTWSTPYITEYLDENTKLRSRIQEKCMEHILEKADETIEQGIENTLEETSELSIFLPESVLEKFSDITSKTTSNILENANVYDEMAASITDFIMEGIAFFIALSVAGIATGILVNVIDIISFLPIIHSTNKLLGIVAGGIRGLLVVWLGMYVIALTATSETAEQLHIYIEESSFLLYLYDNNLVLNIIMYFI